MPATTTARTLTEYEQQWIKEMQGELPPVIARKEIKKALGGMIAPHTLSNADALGDGPEEAHRVGRVVVYKTERLLEWIVQRFGVSQMPKARGKR